MIKPFTITNVREEPCGGRTVFFRIRKAMQVSETKLTVRTMETAIFVTADQDNDQQVYETLKQSGWL